GVVIQQFVHGGKLTTDAWPCASGYGDRDRASASGDGRATHGRSRCAAAARHHPANVMAQFLEVDAPTGRYDSAGRATTTQPPPNFRHLNKAWPSLSRLVRGGRSDRTWSPTHANIPRKHSLDSTVVRHYRFVNSRADPRGSGPYLLGPSV